jgi:hypothetical protein
VDAVVVLIGIGSLLLNVVQFLWSRHTRGELQKARGSGLSCRIRRSSRSLAYETEKIQRQPGGPLEEQTVPVFTYYGELEITNRSERPNSLVSMRIRMTGVDGPFSGFETEPEQRLMGNAHPDFGQPLLPPVNIPAGVSTVKGFVAAQQTLQPEWFDPSRDHQLEYSVSLTDGHGLVYEVAG